MRPIFWFWLFGWGIFLFPSGADACSMCVTAAADKILPPIEAWALWLSILFLIISLIGSLTKSKLSGIPTFGRAIIVVIVLFLSAGAFLGIGLITIFAIPLMIFCVGALRMPGQLTGHRFGLFKVLAFVVIASFLGLGAAAVYTHITRTPADFAIKWAHTAPGRQTIEALIETGPQALPQLRRIASEINPKNAGGVVDALACFGVPELDVPLLIDMLRRDRGESFASIEIEKALTELTGLTLPSGSNYVRWRIDWKKKNKE